MGEKVVMRLRYSLQKTGRTKSLSLRVHLDGSIEVRAPQFVEPARVHQFVARKTDWILDKQQFFVELRRKYPPKEMKNGETFSVLGRHYRLRLESISGLKKCYCKIYGQRLKVFVNGQLGESLKNVTAEALRAWYSDITAKKARSIIIRYAQTLSVQPGRLKIVEQAKRWASCSKAGDIRCNWRLSMMSMPVLEYIVVHELCHLKIHNHSERFWRVLKSILPDFEKRREWLKQQGPGIAVCM